MRGCADQLTRDSQEYNYDPGGYEAAELRGFPHAFSDMLKATARFLTAVATALEKDDPSVPDALAQFADGIAGLGQAVGDAVCEVAEVSVATVTVQDGKRDGAAIQALLDVVRNMPPSPVGSAAVDLLEPMCSPHSFKAYLRRYGVTGYDEAVVFELALHRLAERAIPVSK
jgi:hypothetical protein